MTDTMARAAGPRAAVGEAPRRSGAADRGRYGPHRPGHPDGHRRDGGPPRGEQGGGRPVGPTTGFPLAGVAALLAAVAMLFIAFTTAYLGRRGEPGWGGIALPGVLWLGTAILLAGSGTAEWTRGRARRGDEAGARRGLAWTAALGTAFLLAQLTAWRQLAAQGVYLATNPHSSFFYLLTGAHGLHLLGGLVALGVIAARAYLRRVPLAAPDGPVQALSGAALYWHFMAAVWLYVFALLLWA